MDQDSKEGAEMLTVTRASYLWLSGFGKPNLGRQHDQDRQDRQDYYVSDPEGTLESSSSSTIINCNRPRTEAWHYCGISPTGELLQDQCIVMLVRSAQD